MHQHIHGMLTNTEQNVPPRDAAVSWLDYESSKGRRISTLRDCGSACLRIQNFPVSLYFYKAKPLAGFLEIYFLVYFTRYLQCYIKSGLFSEDACWKGADYILALAPYLLQTPQGACRQWQSHCRCPLVALSSVECFLVLKEHEGLAILAPMWLAKYFRQLKRGNIIF